jgi:hypothetical protein
MRTLSIFGIVLSLIVLIVHVLFDFKIFLPTVVANILIAVFTITLLLSVNYLLGRKEAINKQ